MVIQKNKYNKYYYVTLDNIPTSLCLLTNNNLKMFVNLSDWLLSIHDTI